MNPRVKDMWLTALRSGEYKQGKHQLRTDNKFCCLGVLCDLYAKTMNTMDWVEERRENENRELMYSFAGSGDVDSYVLPATVANWAELPDSNPRIQVSWGKTNLADENDGGADFTHIATLIEEQL